MKGNPRRRFLRVLASAALVAAFVPACSDAELVGIVVSHSYWSESWSGPTHALWASAFHSDGSQEDITSVAAWESSDESVATVSASGVLTRVSTGQVTITASLDGVAGSLVVSVP